MKVLVYLRNRYRYWQMRHMELDEMLLEDVATHCPYFHERHQWQLMKRIREVTERRMANERKS